MPDAGSGATHRPGADAGNVAVAVVPLRAGGKTRLAGVLGAAERERLVTVLARHVVGALLAEVPVLVVTGDPGFAARALEPAPRLRLVPQPPDRPGLNAAVALGRDAAAAAGASRLLVAHADLPLLTAADVRALLAPAAPVVLAPDRAGEGTNALVLDTDARSFAFRFGPGSRAAHAAEAARLGLGVELVRRAGTAADLDTPEDWAALPGDVRDRLRSAVVGTPHEVS
ncbi:2-phospho-L-lactate guanylyltransferase [Georgenia ruanii]|uniref:Phosphoenolpyruvate guanylyltransferase n=1 Tax=Georgenia ruanii TaxID=348442 RepID=A0A7J9UY72_9MICO|nr:2-phospho-L-lactate guanylyltransferase [Georgenia ruanii]MPV89571.1 2-phospho-L-lactate guanylyltransferase [Georgenia ruanii]